MASPPERERGESERRSGYDRRSDRDRRQAARIEPFPRRVQLRRQSDVLAHLGSMWEGGSAHCDGLPCLDSVLLRF
jgi:hypothetical protein